MPIAVDHEARKEFVAEVAAGLIASEGLEATTMRTVAKAAGCSTSILTHYFKDKSALLERTYLSIAKRRRSRLVQLAVAAGNPLRECALALLPIGKEARRDWLVYCAFLASGIAQRELSHVQAQWIGHTVELFRDLLARSGREGASGDVDEHGVRIVAFLTGLSVLNILDPEAYSEARMIELVDNELGVGKQDVAV